LLVSRPWYDVEKILPGVVRVNDGDLNTPYVLPGYGTRILPGAFLTELRDLACAVWAGTVRPRFLRTFAGNGWCYRADGYGMLFAHQITQPWPVAKM
jgi:hypothetical protein